MLAGALGVACSDNEDPIIEPPTPTTTTLTVGYTFTVSQAYLTLADVTVTFLNAEGVQQSEPMTSTTWSKSFTANQSREFGYTVNVVAKANLDALLTEDSYVLSTSYKDSYKSNTNQGREEYRSSTITIANKRIADYLLKHKELHKFYLKWDKASDTFIK